MTVTSADVRTWAQTQGLQVGTRGRLSAAIKAAYKKRYPRRQILG